MVNVAAHTQSLDKVSRQWDPYYWSPDASYEIFVFLFVKKKK